MGLRPTNFCKTLVCPWGMASALPPSFRSALAPQRRPASALRVGVSTVPPGFRPAQPPSKVLADAFPARPGVSCTLRPRTRPIPSSGESLSSSIRKRLGARHPSHLRTSRNRPGARPFPHPHRDLHLRHRRRRVPLQAHDRLQRRRHRRHPTRGEGRRHPIRPFRSRNPLRRISGRRPDRI